MSVDVCWQRPPWRLSAAAAVVAVLVGVVVGWTAAAVLAVGAVGCWGATTVGVRVRGGGFRPIRVTDFIDSAAMDELDAYDIQEARAEAERSARAQRDAPRW